MIIKMKQVIATGLWAKRLIESLTKEVEGRMWDWLAFSLAEAKVEDLSTLSILKTLVREKSGWNPKGL
jgi:hypothetical protein